MLMTLAVVVVSIASGWDAASGDDPRPWYHVTRAEPTLMQYKYVTNVPSTVNSITSTPISTTAIETINVRYSASQTLNSLKPCTLRQKVSPTLTATALSSTLLSTIVT